MCENMECEFPFGFEELQFLKLNNDENMSDVVSIHTKPTRTSPMQTGSAISTADWVEIDNMNKIYESEDSQLDPRSFHSQKNNKKIKKNAKANEILIKKNVEDIKSLNMELMGISESNEIIKNEKWIKNLMTLQGKSGFKLLKPEEMKCVKQEDKELKINIETNDNTMSSINIQIAE